MNVQREISHDQSACDERLPTGQSADRRLSGANPAQACRGAWNPAHSGVMATIRSAAVSDRNNLFELVRAFPTPTPPNSEQFSKALEAKLPDPSSCLLVAEHDSR